MDIECNEHKSMRIALQEELENKNRQMQDQLDELEQLERDNAKATSALQKKEQALIACEQDIKRLENVQDWDRIVGNAHVEGCLREGAAQQRTARDRKGPTLQGTAGTS